MAKIPKNLSDKDMWQGFKEVQTFENAFYDDEPAARPAAAKKKPGMSGGLLTPVLQEKLERLLLEQKLELYKQGIVDYEVKPLREGTRIVLTAAERPARRAENK